MLERCQMRNWPAPDGVRPRSSPAPRMRPVKPRRFRPWSGALTDRAKCLAPVAAAGFFAGPSRSTGRSFGDVEGSPRLVVAGQGHDRGAFVGGCGEARPIPSAVVVGRCRWGQTRLGPGGCRSAGGRGRCRCRQHGGSLKRPSLDRRSGPMERASGQRPPWPFLYRCLHLGCNPAPRSCRAVLAKSGRHPGAAASGRRRFHLRCPDDLRPNSCLAGESIGRWLVRRQVRQA